MSNFIKVTSAKDTPIYIRKADIMSVEGFTFSQDNKYKGHDGSAITFMAPEWSQTMYCIEPVEAVFKLIEP